mmetsp:Transcript_112474/g.350530  ORF Transcript_112474/g.350530 Transcript_112474/m.350530 type:complete len:203 (+) Transcript_112474:1183-1791(+)
MRGAAEADPALRNLCLELCRDVQGARPPEVRANLAALLGDPCASGMRRECSFLLGLLVPACAPLLLLPHGFSVASKVPCPAGPFGQTRSMARPKLVKTSLLREHGERSSAVDVKRGRWARPGAAEKFCQLLGVGKDLSRRQLQDHQCQAQLVLVLGQGHADAVVVLEHAMDSHARDESDLPRVHATSGAQLPLERDDRVAAV